MKYNLHYKNFIIKELENIIDALGSGTQTETEIAAQLNNVLNKLKIYYDEEGWLDCRK